MKAMNSEEEERQQQEEEEEVKLVQLTKGGDRNTNKIAKESGTSKQGVRGGREKSFKKKK
jgi:hypothetical protein